MFAVKLLVCAVLLMEVNGRSIAHEEYEPYYYVMPATYFEDPSPVLINEEQMHPIRVGRERRQAHGSLAFNSDGTTGVNVRLPLAGDNRNQFSAIGGLDFTKNQQIAAGTAGLAYDHINGHGLTVTKTHMPGIADRTAAAGTLNLFNNKNHNLDANAFAARTTLSNPVVPSFNTVGGGLDYMYKNKVGAGVSVARTPFFDKTDYSATGNLNLFRDRSTSLDFKAGLSKSVSPYIPRSSWEPTTGFTFRKFF